MNIKSLIFLLIMAGLSLALSSCEKKTIEPDDQQGEISFSGQVYPIFEQYCNSCHGGSDFALSFENLQSMQLVTPPADSSILMLTINSGHNTSDQVSSSEKKIIADWIDQGSKNN